MTEPEVEQLAEPAAQEEVGVTFTQTAILVWEARAACKHGSTRNNTYLIAPGVPPLNHAQMVLSSRRQHDQIIGCNCPDEPPKVLATVTFGLANGVEAGQQRYIPQASMTTPGGNFFPNTVPMTCRRTGAFQITAKIQLANSVALGARGTGNLLITGLPVLTVAMTDEAGKATANLSGLVNIGANQSVNLGYENTGITAQDVTLATLSLGEIWVP